MISRSPLNTFLKEERAAFKEGQAPGQGRLGSSFEATYPVSMNPSSHTTEIPGDYNFESQESGRLDIWYHGRNNHLSELALARSRPNREDSILRGQSFFIHSADTATPTNSLGRSIPSTIEAVSDHYPIDPDRISVRGFSDGGPRPGTWPSTTLDVGRQPPRGDFPKRRIT